MIAVLQHRVNSRIFRCLNYANRQIFSGYSGSIKCITRRTIYDSVNNRAPEAPSKLKPTKIPKTSPIPSDTNRIKQLTDQGNLCPSVSEINRAKYCKPVPKRSSCPPSKPPPTSPKSNLQWIIGLLALGGAGALAYYLKSKAAKDKEKSGVVPLDGSQFMQKRVPENSSDLPKEVPYLLIGGGTASFSAFRAIKSHDPKAKVLVISNEFEKPYMRPPLSKELWYHAETGVIPKDYKFKQWNGAERSLFYEPEEFYINPTKLLESQNGGVAIAQGYTVKKIDVCDRKATLSDGTEITYGECLIATGCTPKNLNVFEAAPANIREKISVFRTTHDYIKLKQLAESKKSIAVIGSGFLGSELSCALAKHGESQKLMIYQLFYESGNMAKVLPEYLSKWTTEKVIEQGVCVLPNTQIESVTLQNNQLKLTLNNGKSIITDHVVVCIGCEPNISIAKMSGLETDFKHGGFVVNAELEARRHVYVAGDAACFYDPLLGRRRVEHHDHSVVSGRLAGENMIGMKKPYKHQSMFWSDLGPHVGYEGIGIVDSSLPTVGVFAKRTPDNEEPKKDHVSQVNYDHDPKYKESEKNCKCDDYDKGVIFYLKDDKVVGVLLWNIFNRISIARKVINESKKFDDLNEVAKLFDIHS